MGGRTFLTRLLFGEDAAARRRTRRAAGIRALPDRQLMAETWIPAFAAMGGRILWVGCRAYTADDYPALEAAGAEVWTTDIDPEAVRWGREGRHRVGDVCEIDQIFDGMVFDSVICNGVLGFGVDEPDDQRRALAAIGAVLRPGGLLLLGWNTDRISDPRASGVLDERFTPVSFADQPPRVAFQSVTHVYDILRRAGDVRLNPSA